MTLTKLTEEQNSLRIWERLQIVVGDENKEGVYTCRLSDIMQDHLVISRPVFSYGRSLLANNRSVRVNFTRADAAYSFSARITEEEPKAADEMLLVELGEVRRLQRRRFVRIDKMVKVDYYCLGKPVTDKIEMDSIEFQKSYSLNISAGGLLMPVDEDDEIEVGDLLLLDFTRCGLKTLDFPLIVIVRQTREDDEKQKLVGVEFIIKEDLHLYLNRTDLTHLPNIAKQFTVNVQNELVSEMFNEQLALRQKGLI